MLNRYSIIGATTCRVSYWSQVGFRGSLKPRRESGVPKTFWGPFTTPYFHPQMVAIRHDPWTVIGHVLSSYSVWTHFCTQVLYSGLAWMHVVGCAPRFHWDRCSPDRRGTSTRNHYRPRPQSLTCKCQLSVCSFIVETTAIRPLRVSVIRFAGSPTRPLLSISNRLKGSKRQNVFSILRSGRCNQCDQGSRVGSFDVYLLRFINEARGKSLVQEIEIEKIYFFFCQRLILDDPSLL